MTPTLAPATVALSALKEYINKYPLSIPGLRMAKCSLFLLAFLSYQVFLSFSLSLPSISLSLSLSSSLSLFLFLSLSPYLWLHDSTFSVCIFQLGEENYIHLVHLLFIGIYASYICGKLLFVVYFVGDPAIAKIQEDKEMAEGQVSTSSLTYSTYRYREVFHKD